MGVGAVSVRVAVHWVVAPYWIGLGLQATPTPTESWEVACPGGIIDGASRNKTAIVRKTAVFVGDPPKNEKILEVTEVRPVSLRYLERPLKVTPSLSSCRAASGERAMSESCN